jgi:subtilisin family serine protease
MNSANPGLRAVLLLLIFVGSYASAQSNAEGTETARSNRRRAYEPFKRLEEQKALNQQRQQAQYRSGRVLFKVLPTPTGPKRRLMSSKPTDSLVQVKGLKGFNRLFPSIQPLSGKRLYGTDPDQADASVLARWYQADVNDGFTVPEVVDSLHAHPSVEAAEPDYEFKLAGVIPDGSTDPNISQQWHLDTIRAREAWQYLDSLGLPPGGSRDVVVAVIDSGVDYEHPDLAANMWVNRQEIPGNGQDDDWNGFVDDIHGVSVLGDDRDHSGDPMDLNGHGTHCAGIIAAVADNGIGGVGVAYNTRIMAVKAAQYNGTFYASDVAEALYYAVENGADVINMSLSSGAHSKVMADALTVAFGQAVLVAAAGNDGFHNESPPGVPAPKPGFPASYIYCLGVMAQRSAPDAKGQYLTGFSNWDNHPDSRIEYEVMAPGAKIFSTLPGEAYAAWDGTSMAAPVVSGMAALIRTRFPNKATHSSRFIMGQIAATGPMLMAKKFDKNDLMSIMTFGFEELELPSVDAYAALTEVPEPDLSYLEHWLFDTPDQAADNDSDGILDAGETVDLAIVIRNHWGRAEDVDAVLAPIAGYGGRPDPHVTMITDTVNYGAVGSFNQDDNGFIYEDDVLVGVQFPFTFALASDTPNDHVVPFVLTMTCKNGLNPDDSKLYTFESKFEMVVQRGRELPKIIDQDMTLTKQHYWIIDQPTFIPEGVTVTVTEGTQIQFWSPTPRSPYSYGNEPSLLVEGHLDVRGTPTEPVELFPSSRYYDRLVSIKENENGRAMFKYVHVMNPVLGGGGNRGDLTSIDHAYFTQWGGPVWGLGGEEGGRRFTDTHVHAFHVGESIFDEVGIIHAAYDDQFALHVTGVNTCLLDSCNLDGSPGRSESCANNVFLGNYARYYSGGGEEIQVSTARNWGNQMDPDTVLLASRDIRTFQGNSYFILDFGPPSNLSSAQEFAQTLGGSVASIHSEAESQFLEDYTSVALNDSRVFLGMTYSPKDGRAVWLDGSPLDYVPDSFDVNEQPGDGASLVGPGYWYWAWDQYPFIIKVPGVIAAQQIETELAAFKAAGKAGSFENNAFLNEWWNPDINYWMRFFGEQAWYDEILPRYLAGNYWGTTSKTLIEAAIHDWWDQFDLAKVIYEPILEQAPETAYPFIIDIKVATDTEDDAQQVGAEEIVFTVTFNRDMDQSVQPGVSFGPDVPFTDFTVNPMITEQTGAGTLNGRQDLKEPEQAPFTYPGWQDARTWVGVFEVGLTTGDGWQYLRVADAVAADDPWLKTGKDERRFRFEIITGGLSSIDLQAEGGAGHVDLTWHQDDFELFAGFNLYRASEPEPNGVFERIHDTIIPGAQTAFRDTQIQPNTTYYYKYAVVTTDMAEAGFSNTVSAMPLEMNPPQIQHQPISSAEAGLSVTFRATVTDETQVNSVTLHYRQIGQSDFQSRAMILSFNDRYSVTLEGVLISAPGLEYYIEASDGVTTATHGSAVSPHVLSVEGTMVPAPEIAHELVTTAVPGQDLTLVAQITDDVQVVSATLFYQSIGQNQFQSLPMSLVSGDTYQATVGGNLIQTPGIEYYISAKDAASTVTHGSSESPHTVHVGETGSPEITHETPTYVQPGDPLELCARITDNEQVQSAIMYYRTVGNIDFQSLPMQSLAGDSYCVTLPGTAVEAPGLEYYIAASDGTNTAYHGLPTQPVLVDLDDGGGTTPVAVLDNTSDATGEWDAIDENNLAVCQDFLATFDANIGSTIEVTFLLDGTTASHSIYLASYDVANNWVDYADPISTVVLSNAGTGTVDEPVAATVTLTSPIRKNTRYAACIIPSEWMEIKLTQSTSSIDGKFSKFVSWVSPGPEVERDIDFRIKIVAEITGTINSGPVIEHEPTPTADPGQDVLIYAQVTSSTDVASVKLHYRGIGQTTYESQFMVNIIGEVHLGTLTNSLLTAPGLEYYIEASDTTGTSLATHGSPAEPHVIVVADWVPPVVKHEPVGASNSGQPLSICATVTDDVQVASVVLYYRLGGQGAFQTQTMEHVAGDQYCTTLGEFVLIPPVLEYYIQAHDGANASVHGTEIEPHLISVSSPPRIFHELVTGASAGDPLSLYAEVADDEQVTSVKVYYRQVGQVDYQSQSMNRVFGDVYVAMLPGSVIQFPGLEYYFEASDVTNMAYFGLADQPLLMGLGTLEITHDPILKAQVGIPLRIAADVTGDTLVHSVILYYRTTGQPNYQGQSMLFTSGSEYAATLPATAMVTPGLEYYFEAVGGSVPTYHGSVEQAHRVSIDQAYHVIHEPIPTMLPHTPLTLGVTLSVYRGGDVQVTLCYRPIGANGFWEMRMGEGEDRVYRATIYEDQFLSPPGLDYWIQVDEPGKEPVYHGSPEHPHRVHLQGAAQIIHEPVANAALGSPVTIRAQILDDEDVDSATLYYWCVGCDHLTEAITMVRQGDLYSATIPEGALSPNGIAYYIEATDGTHTALHGDVLGFHHIRVPVPFVFSHCPPRAETLSPDQKLVLYVHSHVDLAWLNVRYRALDAASDTPYQSIAAELKDIREDENEEGPIVTFSYVGQVRNSIWGLPGLEYYLEANDGTDTVLLGSPEFPFRLIAGTYIVHTPVMTAEAGEALSISAEVTSNRDVYSVTFYSRTMGQDTYTEQPMQQLAGDTYSVSLPATSVASPGLEYYIEATDRFNPATHGSFTVPHQIYLGDAGEPGTGARSFMVYDDLLALGWSTMGPRIAYKLGNTSPVYTGRYSISFVCSEPGRGMRFLPGAPIPADEYQAVKFYVRGSIGSEDLLVTLHCINGNGYSSPVQGGNIQGGAVSSSEWRLVTVTLNDLGIPSGQQIDYLAINNPSGTSSVYLDSITLSPHAPPVVDDGGGAITQVVLDNTSAETEGHDAVNEYNIALCQDFLAPFDAGIGSRIEVTFLADNTSSPHGIFLAPYDTVNNWVDYANPISTTVETNAGIGGSDEALTATVTLTSPIVSGNRYAACLDPPAYAEMKLTRSPSSINGQSSKFVHWELPGPEVARDTDLRIKIAVKTQGAVGILTPAGSNGQVNIRLYDSATATPAVLLWFQGDVVRSGVTGFNISESGPAPPAGFSFGEPPSYFEIETTASFSGTVEVNLDYRFVNFTGPPQDLHLFQYEDGQWPDITIAVEPNNNWILGVVDSLSLFAVGYPQSRGGGR